jgi:hypothetical protein
MTITVDEIRKDPKKYVLRLKSGDTLSLGNWWIMKMEAEGVYLLDGGDWSGRSFYFKLGDGARCLANTEEGWTDIGVFEAITQKGVGNDETTAQRAVKGDP